MKRVLVGGVFNIIHPGHIYFLEQAKKLGNVTVVLANDKRARKKGYFIPAKYRKKVLDSIKYVDKVIVGNEDDMFKIVKKVKPDIIALGFDQKIDLEKLRKTIKEEKLKTKIVKIPRFRNFSTEKIIKNKKWNCC